MVNVYEILGVHPNATPQEINRIIAKHEINKTLKPEVITKIRLVLLNPVHRQAYNNQLLISKESNFDGKLNHNIANQQLSSIQTPVVTPYHSTIIRDTHSKGAKLKKSRRKKKVAAGEYRVKKWVFILLAFCLGGLGIHWFVAGNYKRGLLYIGIALLTIILQMILNMQNPDSARIPAIMSFVSLYDLIQAARKEKDDDGYIKV